MHKAQNIQQVMGYSIAIFCILLFLGASTVKESEHSRLAASIMLPEVHGRVDSRHYELVEQVPTRPGARTCLYIPESNQLLLAVPALGQAAAELRIYRGLK